MKWISAAAEFVWRIRHQLRFGERSRMPLKLVRLELREDFAECEWLARPLDPWDEEMPHHVREENETSQAICDALSVREFLFKSIPQVRCARLKAYRQRDAAERELIITGSVSRDDILPLRVTSLVMRAKLYGLHFNLSDGTFESLSAEPNSLQFANQ